MSRSRRTGLVLAGLCLLAFLSAFVRFRGPTLGYWDTYIAAPAMFMNRAPVDFVLADGSPAWRYQLRGKLPDDLVDRQSFGIITKDQRFTSAVAASGSFAFAGMLGFRLLFCAAWALVPALALLVWRRAGGTDLPGLLAGAWLVFNPFSLAIDRLNPSVFALPLLLAILALVLGPATWGGLLLAGGLLGTVAGMREEAVCFVPALGLWLLARPSEVPVKTRMLRLATLGGACLLALAPTLHWKDFAFGSPLLHPSQYPHYDGWRPEFPHALLGKPFQFNGLLNWPLHSHLVRTPHFAFPVWVLWPLVTLRALGLVLAGVVAVGTWHLLRDRRALAALALGWVVPLYLLFGPQENWEEVKMTFLVLAYPGLLLLLAAGLERIGQALATGPAPLQRNTPLLQRNTPLLQRNTSLLRRTIALQLGGTMLVLLLGLQALKGWAVPVDPRWYVRFPLADVTRHPAARRELAEGERNDWRYFQTAEHPAELERERAKLTTAWPWPARYLPVNGSFSQAWTEARREAGARSWRVLDIWGYIYGTRAWPSDLK